MQSLHQRELLNLQVSAVTVASSSPCFLNQSICNRRRFSRIQTERYEWSLAEVLSTFRLAERRMPRLNLNLESTLESGAQWSSRSYWAYGLASTTYWKCRKCRHFLSWKLVNSVFASAHAAHAHLRAVKEPVKIKCFNLLEEACAIFEVKPRSGDNGIQSHTMALARVEHFRRIQGPYNHCSHESNRTIYG